MLPVTERVEYSEVEMKRASAFYRGWRMKRNFIHLVMTTDRRLLNDVGFSPDVVHQKLRTPFWKF